jgi:hypothetical protein
MSILDNHDQEEVVVTERLTVLQADGSETNLHVHLSRFDHRGPTSDSAHGVRCSGLQNLVLLATQLKEKPNTSQTKQIHFIHSFIHSARMDPSFLW